MGVSGAEGNGNGNLNTPVDALLDQNGDYYKRSSAFSGIADSKVGTLSMWFNPGTNGAITGDARFFNMGIIGNTASREKIDVSFSTISNKFDIRSRNGSGTLIMRMTNDTAVSRDAWHNLLFSFDLGAGTTQLYLDDAEDRSASPTTVDEAIVYTDAVENALLNISNGGITVDLPMCVSDFYFNSAEAIDLSVTANRRDFIDASGDRVDLGADGSGPTGSQPIICLNKARANWNENVGSGGNFTLNGSVSDCASAPDA